MTVTVFLLCGPLSILSAMMDRTLFVPTTD
jgi:hypothetical protein